MKQKRTFQKKHSMKLQNVKPCTKQTSTTKPAKRNFQGFFGKCVENQEKKSCQVHRKDFLDIFHAFHAEILPQRKQKNPTILTMKNLKEKFVTQMYMLYNNERKILTFHQMQMLYRCTCYSITVRGNSSLFMKATPAPPSSTTTCTTKSKELQFQLKV